MRIASVPPPWFTISFFGLGERLAYGWSGLACGWFKLVVRLFRYGRMVGFEVDIGWFSRVRPGIIQGWLRVGLGRA